MSKEKRTTTEIVEEIQALLKLAEESGWDNQMIADTLEGMEGDIDEKLLAYRKVMDQLEIDAKVAKAEKDAYSDQAKAYADRNKSLTTQRKNMTWPLLNLFRALNLEKKKGAYGTFFIKKNPDKFHIKRDLVPPRFLRRTVKMEVDEDAVKKAIEDGETLDFAWYEKGDEIISLRK